MTNTLTEQTRPQVNGHEVDEQYSHGNVVIFGGDRENVDILAHGLVQTGLNTVSADVEDLTKKFITDCNIDIVINDIFEASPKVVSLCWQLSAMFNGPVVVMGYERDERYLLDLYNAGIAEYITKPISIPLLRVKIKTWIRRISSTRRTGCVVGGGFRIDATRRSVMTPDGRNVRLSKLEFQLFSLLYRNKGRVLTPSILVDRIWGEFEEGDHRLKHLVSRLRKKIEPDSNHFTYIETVGTDGYCLRTVRRNLVPQRVSPSTFATQKRDQEAILTTANRLTATQTATW